MKFATILTVMAVCTALAIPAFGSEFHSLSDLYLPMHVLYYPKTTSYQASVGLRPSHIPPPLPSPAA